MRDDLNTTIHFNISEMEADTLVTYTALPTAPTSTSTSTRTLGLNVAALPEEMRHKFLAIVDENKRLHAVIADVTEINKRWQRYSTEKQSYIERLLATVQEQKKQIDKLTQPRATVCQCTKLETQERLHLEHVKSLELQLEAFQEDWTAERAEKLQLHLEKEGLEARVRQLARQCTHSQAQLRELRLLRLEQVRCCAARSEATSASLFGISATPPSVRSGQLLSRGTTLSLDEDDVGAAAALPDDDDDDEYRCSWPSASPTSRRSSSASIEIHSDLDKWSFASSPPPLQPVKTLKKNASF